MVTAAPPGGHREHRRGGDHHGPDGEHGAGPSETNVSVSVQHKQTKLKKRCPNFINHLSGHQPCSVNSDK